MNARVGQRKGVLLGSEVVWGWMCPGGFLGRGCPLVSTLGRWHASSRMDGMAHVWRPPREVCQVSYILLPITVWSLLS